MATKMTTKTQTVVDTNVDAKPLRKARPTTAKAVTTAQVPAATATPVVSAVKEPVFPNAPSEEAPEPVVDEPQLEESTPVLRKKLTVAKGIVNVNVAPKKSPAKKSPARSPAKKSPARSPRTATKDTAKAAPKAAPKPANRGGARVNAKSKAAAKTSAKTTKPRRPLNTKPTPIDVSGIGIGPAKVKKVLVHNAFNPREHEVRLKIIAAENKPVKPRPTAEVPDPAMPEQGEQTPVDKLEKPVLDVIRAAERAHYQTLVADYEHSVVSAFDEEEKKKYQEARKEASKQDNFNLNSFNKSYNKKFYAGFEAWCKENDSYALGRVFKDKKKGVERERFNQWSRAMALVNKSCLRLSSGVRDTLAAYLDILVMQYAKNGILNCVAEEHSNLQLRHALTPSDGFDERVPMDAFARTLDGYQLALNWIESCRQTREEIRETRRKIKKKEIEGDTVTAELPDYPDPKYEENFEGYVVEICRSVRMQLANTQKTAVDKAKFNNIKVSENFKRFCSIIVYESILRIGSHLKEVVHLKDVKTVNEEIMYHTLRQVSNICGIPFEPIRLDMKNRLEKFRAWWKERREARHASRKEAADAREAAEADGAEAADVDAEDEDAEAEELDEVAVDVDDDVVAGNGDEDDLEEDAEDLEVEYEEN
jgi:hypothetical protein